MSFTYEHVNYLEMYMYMWERLIICENTQFTSDVISNLHVNMCSHLNKCISCDFVPCSVATSGNFSSTSEKSQQFKSSIYIHFKVEGLMHMWSKLNSFENVQFACDIMFFSHVLVMWDFHTWNGKLHCCKGSNWL